MTDAVHTINPICWASHSIRSILPLVSVALTSTVLAVFGGEINNSFKTLVKKRPFIVRVCAFVALVAFGYGALNLAISHLLSQVLARADDLWLAPVVIVAFFAVGVLAEHKRQI